MFWNTATPVANEEYALRPKAIIDKGFTAILFHPNLYASNPIDLTFAMSQL